MICNVLLLADVFEKVRNDNLKNYRLCSSHYLSAPAISWNAMVNMAKTNLELVSDPDMYVFFEEGMTGGVSYISNRYSKANNNYLKSYDPKQKSKHIIQLDANNLQGYEMSKFLPTNRLKQTDPKGFNLNKYTIKRKMLSDYQLKIADLYNIPIANVEKLVPNFFDKEKYCNFTSGQD